MSETFSGAFDGVTRILKGTENPGEAWGKMVALFREVSPDAMWDTLPAPDLEGDIERAVAWLGLHWKPSPRQPVRGVYLGLDTLNQDRGDISKNVEVSMSSAADPEVLSQDYAGGDDNWYGQDHLIVSLQGMKRVYDASESSSFADYFVLRPRGRAGRTPAVRLVFDQGEEQVGDFVEGGWGDAAGELGAAGAEVESADLIGQDGARVGELWREGGDRQVEGKVFGFGGDGADDGAAGFFVVGPWREDDGEMLERHFRAGGGREIRVDDVAAIGEVGRRGGFGAEGHWRSCPRSGPQL